MQYWEKSLSRCRAAGMPWAVEPVQLHGDGTRFHSSPFCPGALSTVEVDPSEAVRLDSPPCSECAGWRTTVFGQRLTRAAECFTAMDFDAAGGACTRWEDLHEWMSQHPTPGRNPRRQPNGDALDRLERDAHAAVCSIADRSRDVLMPAQLERALAAQALRVPVTGSEAELLSSWVRGTRLLSPALSRRHVSEFDEQLTDALAASPTVLLLASTRPGDPLHWGLGAELELLGWFRGTVLGSTLVLHLPALAAAGAVTVNARNSRIGVASTDETAPEVLETVAVLWSDRGSSPSTDATVDELLAVARSLR